MRRLPSAAVDESARYYVRPAPETSHAVELLPGAKTTLLLKILFGLATSFTGEPWSRAKEEKA